MMWTIIRISSAGAIREDVKIMDLVLGMGACTDSNYAYQYGMPGTYAPIATYDLLESGGDCQRKEQKYFVGNVLSPTFSTTHLATDHGKRWVC